ncbi:RimK family protein [Leucothrix mucor]|uniref:RimK family protein n=1 Tax=Leucothrix mucor TaxID=45248 RepID=UPI0003B6C81C|nr:RimK family protein [Leucothrix mucor]
MPEYLLLVDDLKHWKSDYPEYPVVAVNDYLTGDDWLKKRNLRVINLCRNLSYQSLGYYASMLAEARGHRVQPSVSTLQDLTRKALYGPVVDDLDATVNKVLAQQSGNEDAAKLSIMLHFGSCENEAFKPLARKLYEAFRAPLIQVEFKRGGRWRIHSLKLANISDLTTDQLAFFFKTLEKRSNTHWKPSANAKTARYDLAILHNPEDKLPPSDDKALQLFIRAAAKLDINAELIVPKDFGRLLEYDALFIRETTSLNHHTYRFARKAANEGLVVIDDPDSIRRCVNKIFLSELLAANKVPTPASVIVSKGGLERAEEKLGFPMVLKVPDGSFSRGMFKVKDRAEMQSGAATLFKHSELILAQAYTYTEFDWRIGVLNGEALYACRYYMSRGHWQIINHGGGKIKQGKWDTLPMDEVPKQVLDIAMKAAGLIGNGLYGVDLKQTDKGVVVIEVNDNPSIETTVEDKVIGKELYHKVMAEFLRRLDLKQNPGTRKSGS